MPSISKNVRILKRRVLQAYRVEVPKKQTFIKEVLKAIRLRRSHFFCPVPTASQSNTGMHGRGSQASAPASDAAGRGDAGGTPQTARPCHVVPRGDSRIGPTRLKSAPTRPKSAPMRPKSGRLGPYRPYRPI